MKDVFYILYSEENDWYQLILTGTHYCVSCGPSLDKLLEKVHDYIVRYKTKDSIYRAMSHLDDHGKVHRNTYMQREQAYKDYGGQYKELIDAVVEDSMREVRQWQKEHSPLRKVQKRLKSTPKLVVAGKSTKSTMRTPALLPAKKSGTIKPMTKSLVKKKVLLTK